MVTGAGTGRMCLSYLLTSPEDLQGEQASEVFGTGTIYKNLKGFLPEGSVITLVIPKEPVTL